MSDELKGGLARVFDSPAYPGLPANAFIDAGIPTFTPEIGGPRNRIGDKQMTNFKTMIACGLLSIAVAGCTATEREQRAGTGALVGAGVGALAGQAIGRDTRSTVVGAGALLGAVAGSSTTPRAPHYCRYQRRDGTIYTARCPA
jgi:hypothetical protein